MPGLLFPDRSIRLAVALSLALWISGCGIFTKDQAAAPCQGTRPASISDKHNRSDPELGCANTNNLAAMVSDSADLIVGVPLSPDDGSAAVRPIEAERQGKRAALANDASPQPAIVLKEQTP